MFIINGELRPKKIDIDVEDLYDNFASEQGNHRLSPQSRPKKGQPHCPACGVELASAKKPYLILALLIVTIALLLGISYLGYISFFSQERYSVPEDYTTIQAAIDAANRNVVVSAEPGHYNEVVTIEGKSVSIESTGSGIITIGALPETTEEVTEEIKNLFGDELVYASSNKVSTDILGGKIIGVYFTAAWCGPCRQFSPILVEAYNTMKAEGIPFEVVHVSSDRNRNEMLQYMKDYDMQWPATEFGSSSEAMLKAKIGIGAVPYLVIIDTKGEVMSTDGRKDVLERGARAFEIWDK